MKNNIAENIVIKIPFHDVDAFGFVWHGCYVKYLEIARCALMDKLDYSYNQMSESGYAWPVVSMFIKYISSSFFEQEIQVNAELIEYENCIKIFYTIIDLKTGKKMATAKTTQISIDLKTKETQFISPECFTQKVKKQLKCCD